MGYVHGLRGLDGDCEWRSWIEIALRPVILSETYNGLPQPSTRKVSGILH
jgi:hypothetical protein